MLDPEGDIEAFCEWALALDGSCYDDCEGEDAMEIAELLDTCEDLLDVEITNEQLYDINHNISYFRNYVNG